MQSFQEHIINLVLYILYRDKWHAEVPRKLQERKHYHLEKENSIEDNIQKK